MHAKDREFLRERLDRRPWLAQAPTSVKPHLVAGEHCSVRLRQGWRLWGFPTEEARDQFVVQYNASKFP
jgi:hypothetical protein